MSLGQAVFLAFLGLGCLRLGANGVARPAQVPPPSAPLAKTPTVAELEAQTRRNPRPLAPIRLARESDIQWAGPTSGPLLWPVPGGRLSLRYGVMGGQLHAGVDVRAKRGAPVHAAATGRVSFVGLRADGYGNLVVLDHAGGWQTAYAHNEVNLVRKGQRVFAGHVVARVGSTGHTVGPTLHFEVRAAGVPKNPLRYFRIPAEGPTKAVSPDAVSLFLP